MLDITDKEFQRICEIMHSRTGVALKPTKKPLVISRLRKRLEELKISGFSGYIPLLEQSNSAELEIFINAITTNETYFFRHIKQFNFLFEHILPEFIEQNQSTANREFRVWSAACSSGEEPYSIAISCQEFFKKHPGWRFRVFASDINSEVINDAKEAQYPERSFKEMPTPLKDRYFRIAPSDNKRMMVLYELDQSIKSKVEFFQHNLLKQPPGKMMDVIFLRNVMIYFDNPVKEKVVNLLENNLKMGGYFFISLSETLSDITSGLKNLNSSIYQRTKG